jgi:ankyrin repeat protein
LLTMALVDLTDDEVVDFIKFLISKGANVNTADLKGLTPLHLLATYDSKLSHQDSKIKELVDKEEANVVAVIKLLLENGADLTAKCKQDKTPFSYALGRSKIAVLDLLSDRVKLSENLQLLHDFRSYIFHESYLAIFYKLLKRDEANLKAQDYNTLDATGFSVFLNYIRSWTQNYNIFYSNVSREVNY